MALCLGCEGENNTTLQSCIVRETIGVLASACLPGAELEMRTLVFFLVGWESRSLLLEVLLSKKVGKKNL